MDRLIQKLLLVLLLLFASFTAFAEAQDWPRTLPFEQGSLTIYSPQVDEFDGTSIKFRAALAYRENPDAEPVFGAGWFESPVQLTPTGRQVRPTELKLTEVRFPSGTGDLKAGLAAVTERESSRGTFDLTLDEIEASLDATSAESLALDNLNTSPPRIIYRDHPALLVSLDGEPVIREIENSPYTAVINTPYPLVSDGRYFYLNAAKDVWYRSREATGPYQFEKNPPDGIAALVEDSAGTVEQSEVEITAANAPEIVVTTEPAELVVTEGPAVFVPLVDNLLVLQNSDDDVFMHVSTQKFYIVLAGRWYESSVLNGPWTYRASENLPASFENIPVDSNQADSRVYVAGTDEAREAVLDAQVPQTAAVARGQVDMDVQYDGDPSFDAVDGADLTYASNTGSTVIQANGMYYLVEDGVWYVSSTPNGPWLVSDHRPPQVVSIQPSSPVYNVRYVYVYDSTPDVVYVGYTPGYLGSYVYHNTLFYGSGWYYAPWVSPYYYYPRHGTWGFNVSYNSWSGWNFGLSWGWGPFSVGYFSGGYWHHHHHWHHRHYGRWGPGRYRPRPHHRGPYRHHRPRAEHYADRNLYRDGRQRARIAGTGERLIDQKGRRYNKNSGRNGKYEKSRTVKARSIREKAEIRDAKAVTSRKRLVVRNDDKARRAPAKASRKQEAIRRKTPSAKSRNKPVSISRTLASSKAQKQTRTKKPQTQSRKQPSQRVVKPQVAQRQNTRKVVQRQSKPQVIQPQSKSQQRQALKVDAGKSFASRQDSKSRGGKRVKTDSRTRRSSRK